MRCVDVRRELAAPTGALAVSEVDGHLDACPRCRSWAAQAEQLDQLWEATRPEAPPGSFETTWARVCETHESKAPVEVPSRRRWVWAAAGLAQAAAVLLAAF